MKQLLYITLLIYNLISVYSQNDLSFDEEEITFELEDNVFKVLGIYYFSSESENSYTILFPFPEDTIYGKPYDLLIKNLNTGDTVNYKTNNDSSSIIFRIFVDQKTTLLISYFQQLKSNCAKYILMSTNQWSKPLKRVDYKLITDTSLYIKKFSILPDQELNMGSKRIYIWQKNNFIPVKDFKFDFDYKSNISYKSK